MLIPKDVRRGNPGEPFACKTSFGWCLYGNADRCRSNHAIISNFTNTVTNSNQDLERKIESLWAIEHDDNVIKSKHVLSPRDKRVLTLWDQKCQHTEGRFELPIPWKDEDIGLPNNFEAALKRLNSLEKSLIKRGLLVQYNEEIQKLLDKSYAEIVQEPYTSPSKKVWYLPHHAVPKKDPTKLRLVFDCASKYREVSLNESCMQGPDMNNNIFQVLLRFRQSSYAIMADIEAMYNQISVPLHDRDSLRFLWRDKNGRILYLRMKRHLFGGVWCSSAATYALRESVELKPCPKIVKDTVNNSFYVDDLLTSVDTPEEVRTIVKDTKSMLADGGFNLTKFVISDEDLLNELVPKEDRAEEVKEFWSTSQSKTLGIRWDVASDEFYFEIAAATKTPVTKRAVLRFVASIYDPLGLISPIIVAGKMIFQQITRLKVGWDNVITGTLAEKWLEWVASLKCIHNIHIPRCVRPSSHCSTAYELHVFCDASEKAYGSCIYLRCVNQDGEISSSLLCSKSRLSPLKSCSIPRLELQAAVLGVRLERDTSQALNIDLSESYYWTDSTVVLAYIKNESRRFHVFVANRVAEIHQSTNSSQWHHIPGKANPADVISRGEDTIHFDVKHWNNGPPFLIRDKCEWEIGQGSGDLAAGDPEIKQNTIISNVINDQHEHPIDMLCNHYSSLYRLKRATAWLIKIKNKLLNRDVDHSMTTTDIMMAEYVILLHVQRTSYHDEIKRITVGQPVKKSSSLFQLSPILDENSILRVSGRIKHSSLERTRKEPYIIPHTHPLALLIARDCHDISHSGREWTLGIIRKKYWITRARKIIAKVSRDCSMCKLLFATPPQQKMADLPPARLTFDRPAFAMTGVDCFGPFLVRCRRSEVKRYGCIFSCFNTRAIHIEILPNLDTDSFINGLRRFVSRRGVPEELWSDNGTNFRGASNELSRSFKSLDQEKIHHYCSKESIVWKFNPPCASNMGGVWERMIRTVRRVLNGILQKNVRLTDDILSTFMCEAESIVNGRPLTKISDDSIDPPVLSPNHLLLLKEGPRIPPGEFSEADMYRRRWKHVQHLANTFWRRWLAEYIPELQKRQRWNVEKSNLKEGQIVLVTKENTLRGLWPLGIIVGLCYGLDGLVRTVKIKTTTGEIVCPINTIVLLEADHK